MTAKKILKLSPKQREIYFNRINVGVKANASMVFHSFLLVVGIVLVVLAFVLSVIPLVGAGAIFLVYAGIKVVHWLTYPKDTIAVEPGKVILFPYNDKKRIVFAMSDIIRIRQNKRLARFGFEFINYSVTIILKDSRYIKVHYVKNSDYAVRQIKKIRYHKPVAQPMNIALY